MKTAGVLASCLFLITLVGAGLRSDPKARAKTLPPTTAQSARRKGLQDGLLAGRDLFKAARYEQAKDQFERVREAAIAPPDPYIETRAVANIGGCWFALHQYKLALKSFVEAQGLAEKNGDTSAAAALDANVASLYSEMGERDAAVAWLERSLAVWTGEDRAKHLPQLEFEMASLRARQGRLAEAKELFRQGIDAAGRAGDQVLVAVGYNKLGEELLRTGQAAAAEGPFLHSYYVRKLYHLPLEGSYTNLGKLRLAQGDLSSASALLDRAVEISERTPGAMPTWDPYLARGELHLAQGRFRDALADLRVAMRLARAWRWSLPSDDASHIGAEGLLDRIYSDLVEAGNRLYLQTGDPALIRETFEANEENRAMSLRMLVQDRRQEAADYPPAYWEAIARLQQAEVNALQGGDQEAVSAARAAWIRAEDSVSPDLGPLPTESLESLRAALDSDAAFLSVRLGGSASWMWAVDREGLALYRLPPRTEILSQAERAERAIRENRAGSDASVRLYRTLFEPLAVRFRNRSRWLLALDPGLLDLPVAALEVEGGPRPVYLAERHVIQIVPGAGFWLETAARQSRVEVPRLFLGVGDPIYNKADPRLPQAPAAGRTPTAMRWLLFAASGPRNEALALPRLVGSGAEVDRCARGWNGESIVLKGRDASGEKVREALQRNPAVVHFAVHFIESSQARPEALMALGLGASNEPELIAPVEISHWRTHAGLVVLSGCDSAAGAVLPGAGLMGLTRAWLTAGAQSVLASRWATPDEDGALFAAFYREYGTAPGTDASTALSRAQTRMIREGGRRARPAYWGAWFVVGN